MSADKLKAQLTGALLDISEKCAAAALVAAGVVVVAGQNASAAIVADVPEGAAMVQSAAIEASPQPSEGAINLWSVTTDPTSGEQITQHYSHASHSSHSSHTSHYSSR
ncbi:MAG: hypothetical protein IPK66_18755 [Rhodospirillales bacterium]|nr:hypothetical protein [Rhodospirillales bacterium]